MPSTTDSPNKTFTTLQNVIDCPPSPSAVVADLYAEVGDPGPDPSGSVTHAAIEETDAVVTTGAEVTYVSGIEDFVYFDPSASIKYE